MLPIILLLAVPLAAGIYLVVSARKNSRDGVVRSTAGIFLMALPPGGLGYLFSSIWIAREQGVGHLFSVPSGGYSISDSALLSSLGCWRLFSAAD
jgi:hypothetical protein